MQNLNAPSLVADHQLMLCAVLRTIYHGTRLVVSRRQILPYNDKSHGSRIHGRLLFVEQSNQCIQVLALLASYK